MSIFMAIYSGEQVSFSRLAVPEENLLSDTIKWHRCFQRSDAFPVPNQECQSTA